MKRYLTLGLAAGLTAVLATFSSFSSASADEHRPVNPAQFCTMTNNADGYLASTGGCVSSVASIGIDALMEGAFPSRAAAVATCRQIADFYGGYPFYFYGNVGNPEYRASNHNSCVRILYAFHTGALAPGFQG
jgi:hypothetical protein